MTRLNDCRRVINWERQTTWTCSVEAIAQKTISAKFREGNGLYVIPPRTWKGCRTTDILIWFLWVHNVSDESWFSYQYYHTKSNPPIVHQPSNILFGHFWELFLENVLETRQENHHLVRLIIQHDLEANAPWWLGQGGLCDSERFLEIL